MSRRPNLVLLLTVLALALAGCFRYGETGSSSIGGAVSIEQAAETGPFFDPTTDELLIAGGEISADFLDRFEPPDPGMPAIDETVVAVGRLGELQVGTWEAEDDVLGRVECVGYRIGTDSASSQCDTPSGSDNPRANPIIYFDLSCPSGDGEPVWRAFSIDERVDGLHFEMADGASVIGTDPADTGLVAVEATGELRQSTAQTTTGQVWLLDFLAACG